MMSRRLPVLLVSATTALSLAACGSDSSPAESSGSASSDSTSSAPTSAASSSSSSASSSSSVASSAPAPAAASPVALNKTITDPVLGHSVVVLKYVSGYQPSAAAKAKYSALEDQNVLLVQVKATAGSKYYNSVSTTDFRLTKTENGIDTTPTSILDDEVKAAGYPILENVSAGKTGTGWVVFTPKKEYTKLVFAYKRLAYKISGKTVPEQVFPLPLN